MKLHKIWLGAFLVLNSAYSMEEVSTKAEESSESSEVIDEIPENRMYLLEPITLKPTVEEIKEAKKSFREKGYKTSQDFYNLLRTIINSDKNDSEEYAKIVNKIMTVLTFKIENGKVKKFIAKRYKLLFANLIDCIWDFLGNKKTFATDFTKRAIWQLLCTMPNLYDTLISMGLLSNDGKKVYSEIEIKILKDILEKYSRILVGRFDLPQTQINKILIDKLVSLLGNNYLFVPKIQSVVIPPNSTYHRGSPIDLTHLRLETYLKEIQQKIEEDISEIVKSSKREKIKKN